MELPVASAGSIVPYLRREMDGSTGTWVLVGWDGQKMGAGKRVRTGIPHLRVHVTPEMSDEDIMLAVAGAIAQLRTKVRDALEREAKDGRPKHTDGHVWGKYQGLKSRRRKA